MYTSLAQWMNDPDFVLQVSVCPQIGEPGLSQAINRFKAELSPLQVSWKENSDLSVEEKLALVRKMKMSAAYVGCLRLHKMALSMEQPLEAGVNQPIDPLMAGLEEMLIKFEKL